MTNIKKIENEYERVKNEFNDNREAIAIDSANVYLLDEKVKINLPDFLERKTSFDGYYSFYYMKPGEIKTIKQFLLHAITCDIKRVIINELINGKLSEEDKIYYFTKYDLTLI